MLIWQRQSPQGPACFGQHLRSWKTRACIAVDLVICRMPCAPGSVAMGQVLRQPVACVRSTDCQPRTAKREALKRAPMPRIGLGANSRSKA